MAPEWEKLSLRQFADRRGGGGGSQFPPQCPCVNWSTSLNVESIASCHLKYSRKGSVMWLEEKRTKIDIEGAMHKMTLNEYFKPIDMALSALSAVCYFKEKNNIYKSPSG